MPLNRPPAVSQLLEIWSRLSLSQKTTIFVFGFLGMMLIGSLVFFMNRVEYGVLYPDLTPEDAHAVMEKLREENRKFIVEGTTIKVAGNRNEVDQLRIDYIGLGLVGSGTVDFGIFDESQFGMTDFTEHINYQRALQGELGRTISSLNEVVSAKVHIVLPDDSRFDQLLVNRTD